MVAATTPTPADAPWMCLERGAVELLWLQWMRWLLLLCLLWLAWARHAASSTWHPTCEAAGHCWSLETGLPSSPQLVATRLANQRATGRQRTVSDEQRSKRQRIEYTHRDALPPSATMHDATIMLAPL
jgi:hypothetical protein